MNALLALLASAALLCAAPASAQGDALAGAVKKGAQSKFDKKNDSASGGVAGHALDLSGLLGPAGRATPGPSVDDAGPDKYTKMVLAAVEQLDAHKGVVVAELSQAFNGGVDENAVAEAAKVIKQRIGARRIKVGQGEGMTNGAAAYWQPEPEGGDWLVGTMGLQKQLLDGTAASYRATAGAPGFAFNCGADQVANSVLHETTHIFYTYFAKVKGLQAKNRPIGERFTTKYHWNGPVQAGSGSAARCKRLDPEAGVGYSYFLTKSGYAADDGNEASARAVAARLQDETQGAALAAVLRELF